LSAARAGVAAKTSPIDAAMISFLMPSSLVLIC
jgi:hypothetical protein